MAKFGEVVRRVLLRCMAICLSLIAVLGITGPNSVLAEPPANAFRFFHDADGRLKAAIDPEGETAIYNWDAAGNLSSISRGLSSKLSIIQLSPAKSAVGDTIKIKGTGFSSTPASNTVKFNGTVATVEAATPWSLTVKVPAEATSGAVTVATGGEPVTSPENFTVAASTKPSISSISPTIAAAGEEVTISGSNFDSSLGGSTVTVNRSRPEVVSVTESAIKAIVPEATLGGHVAVATGGGAVVGPDLYIPPEKAAVSKVGTTGRFSVGEATTATISKGGTIALKLFDGTGGQKISLLLSEATFSGSISIWSPKGAKVSGSEATFSSSSSKLVEPVTLPETGTYTIRLTGSGEAIGSVKLTAYLVSDLTGSITPTKEGAKQSVSITTPGQNARYSVEVKAGQSISVKTSSASFDQTARYYVEWLNPEGSVIASEFWNGKTGSGFWGRREFTSPGTYTLKVNPEGSMTGSVALTLWDATDTTGSITPSAEGGSGTYTVDVPGQRNVISFAGTAGQSVSVVPSGATFSGLINIFKPSGSELPGSQRILTAMDGPLTLPETGTYTIRLTGSGEATGSVKLTVYLVSDLTGSITPTKEGAKQSVSITTPGQNALYSVEVKAGQSISVKTSNASFNQSERYYVEWLDSKGSQIATENWFGKTGSGFWKRQEFTSAGTYTLKVNPDGSMTGSVDLTAWDATDKTGDTITPSAEGGSGTYSVDVPGQRELITFSGAAGQNVSVVPSGATFSGNFSIFRPNGAEVGNSGGGIASMHGPVTLPENGTYTIRLAGNGEPTGSVKLTAYLVSDLTGSIPPTKEGAKQSVSITTPGQNALYSVEVKAGQSISMKTTNANFNQTERYYLEWRDSKGGLIASEFWNGKTGSGFWGRREFTSTGTYTLQVNPEGSMTGSVDLTVWDATDKTGATITPTTEGESKAVSVDVPGQRTLVTFSGTSGTTVTLKVQEANFPGTMSVWKPDGTSLSGSEKGFSSSSTARAEVSLPTTGTYTIRLIGSGDNTGSGVLVAYLGSHVAWQFFETTTTQLVSYEVPSFFGSGSGAQVGSISVPGWGRENGPHGRDDRLAQPPPRPRDLGHSPNRPPGVTQEMLDFQPSATTAWHPARARPGVRGWEAGKAESPWTNLASRQDSVGTSALAGQALAISGLPLAGIRVSLEGSSVRATSDRTGRFLLSGIPTGHQKLIVDGETANGKERYGSYEIGVDLRDHETTTLDYTIWLTPLNDAGNQRVDSPTKQETRLTTPRIPGLEVRIPAGTVIRNAAGHVVKKLNLSPNPVDHPPFPLPPFVSVPLYFTLQPGRAYLSKGAQIIYPNWSHLPPGQRVDFWNYDADDRGWYVYGRGTVTPNGEQVVPDPGVQVWEFTGAMIATSPLPPNQWPNPGGGRNGGDPVDLYSGLFVYQKNDLTLPDSVPISIERTYRPQDSNSYAFGTGTTSLYDMRLWSNNNFKEADLILPSGGRVHYVRISEGTGWTDAIYRSTSSPGPYFGSTITWDGSVPGWNLKMTNGYTFVFGEVAPLQAIRDPYGNTLTLTRTSGQTGNITKITAPHGRWAKFSYDGSNRITEVTDNGGRHLKYAYSSGRLTKVEGLAGRTTEYEYDGSGRMKAIVNPRGNKYLQIAYDANGRVEKQTAADGGVFAFSYKLTEAGKAEATTVTDPLGNQRKVTFSSEGLPTSETEAPGTELARTRSFEPQAATGLVLSETDPLGHKIAYEYDSNGNVKEITQLAGTEESEARKFVYESGTNRVIEETDPLGHTTKYQYGSKGELLKSTDALGHETTFEYNFDGQPTAITDGEGETTKLAYEDGDLVGTTNPLGNTTSQFVDALGRVRAVTLPGGERYLYGYNEANQLTSIKTPLGAETTFEYDANGNRTAIIDPRSGKTTIAYDVMDRLTKETDPLEKSAEWIYNKAGDLVESVDRRGKVSKLSYDELRRPTSIKFGVSGETSESSTGYEYDEADRLIGVSDSAGGEYTLGYDNLNRLTSVEGPNGNVDYEYDGAGRRTLMEVPGGTVEYEYDQANRMTELASGEHTVSLAYDKANRLETLTLPDGIEQLYGYDKASQATSIAYKDGESTLGEINYAYDVNGRTEAMWGSYARLGLPEALKSTKYNAANQLTEREGKALTYDADGNLTKDESNEYTWNARGQLAKISGAITASFGYDPFGRRISKTLGGTTTKLLYDGANVVQELVGESVTADMLTGLGADQLFSRTTEAGTSSYLTDRLGSVIALANGTGEVKTSYTYDPFGGIAKAGEATDNPFQFTGRENDGGGLQYNRARYYSSLMERFISRDPAGFEGSGANLYWYAYGNPVDVADPSGECPYCNAKVGNWSGGGEASSGPGPLDGPQPPKVRGGCVVWAVGGGIKKVGAGASVTICLVYGPGEPGGPNEFGLLSSDGVGPLLGGGVSGGLGPLITDASSLSDLAGDGTYGGLGGGAGPGGGVTGSQGDNGVKSIIPWGGFGYGGTTGEGGRSTTGVCNFRGKCW